MASTAEQMEGRARECVARLREALEEDRLVARFVDAYVAATNRTGLRSSQLRYRELLSTITREAWVALAARLIAELPGKLVRGKARPAAGSAAADAADAFHETLVAELAKALLWTPSDQEEFRRDVALYGQITARQPRPMRSRGTAPSEGAFVDRCALLLDPSLFDKAREAAGKFLVELDALAEMTLQDVFRKKEKN